jgi:hypothetical protein
MGSGKCVDRQKPGRIVREGARHYPAIKSRLTGTLLPGNKESNNLSLEYGHNVEHIEEHSRRAEQHGND